MDPGALSWRPFWVSIKLAGITTIILFVLCLPAAYIFVHRSFPGKVILDSIVSLPLVLPPTVLGFYLLLLLSPHSAIGRFVENTLGLRLVFNFWGMVIGCCMFSFPFMFRPLRDGMAKLPRSLIEASFTLGKSELVTLRYVILPNIKPSLLTGLITTFAHTIGSFGVVLMVGGNISASTKVVSIAIFEEVEQLNFEAAHTYCGVLVLCSFAAMVTLNVINRRMQQS
ncbi:molybdenum ABC transporter permease subunit [bacterium M21]|nr:molybdenum ABC transporter permease subunit [bacterium M21]